MPQYAPVPSYDADYGTKGLGQDDSIRAYCGHYTASFAVPIILSEWYSA